MLAVAIPLVRLGQNIVELLEGQTLTGEPILAGFSVAVSDLFPLPVPIIAKVESPQV